MAGGTVAIEGMQIADESIANVDSISNHEILGAVTVSDSAFDSGVILG